MAETIWRDLEAESYEEVGVEENYFKLDKSHEDDNSLVDTCKIKERVIKSSISPLTINVDKPVLKKLTSNHMNSKLLNHIATEMSRLDDQEVPSVVSLLQPEESLNAEETDKSRPQSITEVLRQKPCATVEPKQSIEVEPDSPSATVNVTSSDTSVIVDDVQETSHHQPEEQLDFEIIAEEIIPEEDTALVYSDLNGQVNVAPENVLSTVNITATEPCNGGAQTEMIIDNPPSRNALSKSYNNYSKERMLVSLENHSVLSPIVENKPDYFSIVRREDSYDETMLSRLFSEATADDASDDENNYTSRNKFAHGGKVTAFSKQMDESKSDVEEESESPQSSHIEPLSPEDSRVEADYEMLPRLAEVDAYNQCRKVRVRLNDINMHPDIGRKNVPDPEGMSNIILHPLHNQTKELFRKYFNLQNYYFNIYNSSPNTTQSNFCPSFHKFLIFNCEDKCNCNSCFNSLLCIRQNWVTLEQLFNPVKLKGLNNTALTVDQPAETNVVNPVDDKDHVSRNPSYVLNNNNESTNNNYESTIKPTATNQRKSPTQCEASVLVESVPERDKPLETIKVPEQLTSNYSSKTGYSSLPPKKRKAFNLQLSEAAELESSANLSPKIAKIDYNKSKDEMPLDHRLNECEKSLSADKSSNNDVTKDCCVVVNRLENVVIKCVGGRYYTNSKTSPTAENSDRVCSDESLSGASESKKKHAKSACRHGKNCSDRRLEKEQKRLKKLLKKEKKKLKQTD